MIPRGKDIRVLIIAAIILVPIIFFPASSDLSVFMLGGKIIAEGGELYKDFFDLKAPLTYYFFALLDMITGGNIIGTRVIEFILTITILLSSNFIFKSFEIKDQIRNIFTVVFSICYVTLNYGNTLQCETIAFLPMIWYFYLTVKPNRYSLLYKGILLGILISFKYTLGIIFLADFLLVSGNTNYLKMLLTKSIELVLSVCLLLLTFLPTFLQGNWIEFENVITYIDTYKSYPNFNFVFIKNYIKDLGFLFGDLYSITLSSSAVVGLLYVSKVKSISKKRALNFVIIFFLLLFLSFLIERKTTLYQFSRVYPFLILLSSIGIYYFNKTIKTFNIYIMAFVFMLVLLLSPVPRLVNIAKIPYSYFKDGRDYLLNFNLGGGTGNFKIDVYARGLYQ